VIPALMARGEQQGNRAYGRWRWQTLNRFCFNGCRLRQR